MKKYFLKNKDKIILSFCYSQEMFEKYVIDKITNVEVNKENQYLTPHNLNLNNIEKWIKSRKIPKNRAFVDKILETLPNNCLITYIDYSLGLSLNDSYWIVSEENEKKLKWNDVNLYHPNNHFSEIVANLAFSSLYKSDLINPIENNIITSPEFTTNGMLKKCWKKENGKIFLLKGQTEEFANFGKEAFSEYFCYQIAKIFEKHGFFKAIKYDLDLFNNEIVSKCEIFTNEDIGFISMFDALNIKNQDEKQVLHQSNTLNTPLIKKIYGLFETFKLNKNFIQDLMLFDAIIGNDDRHLGNFGFLIDNNKNQIIDIAPVFDNGMSLLNQMTLDEMKNKDDLIKYNKIKTNAFNQNFEYVLENFIEERHIDVLNEILNMKFEFHLKDKNIINKQEWGRLFFENIKKNISYGLLNYKIEKQNKENFNLSLKLK